MAVADAIAAAIVARGGRVERRVRVTSIVVEGDRVIGVSAVGADGAALRWPVRAVVSNAGPRNTAKLLAGTRAEEAFAERVRDVQTTSMLALAFSAREEIVPHPGIWAFTDTERLCNLANLSATCPELAPDGRTLYEAYSVPRPSVGGAYDAEAERALLEADLRRMIPGYDRAEVVLFKAMRGDATPAQQVRPGYDLDVRTPIANLVEVGDGVKPYGWIGTTACAQTARQAVDALAGELSRTPAAATGALA